MTRLNVVKNADGKAAELLGTIEKKLGVTPNIFRIMANSPAVLEAYMGFSGALAGGKLPATIREQIALTVAETNSCEYCLAAHTTIGKMVGLNEGQLTESRKAFDTDPKISGLLAFAKKIVEQKGNLLDSDVTQIRELGWGDAEIAEVVANVSLNIFTNYVNHVAGTEIDFPKAPPLGGSCARETGKSSCGCS